MDLIADIGATNARCALLDDGGQTVRAKTFVNRNFGDLEALLRHFVDDTTLDRAALAVAAPITGDEVALLNIDWRFSRRRLARALSIESLMVLNDFEALALALGELGRDDCHPVGGGKAVPGAPMAVLGPGTGLGVATAVPTETGWTAVSGEGGHVTLPALSETEASIVADYRDASGHCSAERLLSGSGVVRIYSSLARRYGRGVTEMPPEAVTEAAAAGDDIASAAFDIFFAMLGTVAGNLALTVGARGGVYIAGGIVPRVVPAFEQSAFRERFTAKGRYREYLDSIPTSVITVATPAFHGLRKALGHN